MPLLAFGDPESPEVVGYIAKCPHRFGLRECVTEEMISKVGRLLPLRVAESKLVRLPPGDAKAGAGPDVRFLSRDFLRRGRGESLRHGVELFAAYLGETTAALADAFGLGKRTEESKFYTLENALEVLRWYGRTPSEQDALQARFARMLAYDALVGSQDRHPENWGVIENVADASAPRRFAPVYDTARGLFVTHSDEDLKDKFRTRSQRACSEALRRYAHESRPIFGCGKDPGSRINHFSLIRYGVERFPAPFGGGVRQLVRAFNTNLIAVELRKRFGRIIARERMELIVQLLVLRRELVQAALEGRTEEMP
jgi:hypothetical protein